MNRIMILLAAASGAAAVPILSLNTTSIKHLDWVRLTFSGLPINNSGVFFAVFYPASANTRTYWAARERNNPS